jgi:acyl-CoA synthetase (AMP-forming)/AMP-acid ligase II
MTALPPIPELTLPEFVLDQAERHGPHRALIDLGSGREMTYRELAIAVRKVAGGLFDRDVRQDDVLALCAPNSIEFVLAWYAASSIGAIVTTLNPASTADELAHQLRHVGARWLVTTAELYEEKLRGAAHAAGIAQSVLIGARSEPSGRAIAFDGLDGDGQSEAPPVHVSPRDVAFLPFSSGTTGLPKSVELTHRNLVANLCQMRSAHHVFEDDVVLAVLPLFHIFGLQVTLNLSLRAGATVVLLPRFELKAFLNAIQTYAVTRAEVVPPIVLALAKSELVDRYLLASLRTMTAGAAPLSADLARACAERIGCRVKQGYGMTELGGGSHVAPDDGPDRSDGIGPALPGVECRVVDSDTGTDVGTNEPGELWIRSEAVMRGYLGDPEATAATLDTDGWLRTGDIVTVDEDGWFSVTDRIKELIKYKGFQVAPAELEGILLTHPAIADAAVVRSPDEQAGEVPKAFIVPRGPVAPDELMVWMAARVAPYKRIRRVEFVEQIPKSPSGKILRRQLVNRERGAYAEAA